MRTSVTTSGRDQGTSRHLLDSLKKSIPFAQGLVITTVPRGDLQIAQPSNVSEGLLKAYGNGFHAEDCATWQAILQRKVVRLLDCWDEPALAKSAYGQELLQPGGLKYVAVAPVASPVLEGYPGAVHLCRTAEQGDFTRAELEQVTDVIRKFEEHRTAKPARRGVGGACATRLPVERPPVYFLIVDEKGRTQVPEQGWNALDARLRHEMLEYARRQVHLLNGHGSAAERLTVADSHGDVWVFRQVTYKKYPALGSGAFTFFCLQPECFEWGMVKPADFQADPELSRLIPALRFMQQEFSRGPTLVEIAQTVNLSPFHFHRRFTELLGLTPKQFMLNCQIHMAKSELVAATKELVQIAKECGFAHQSHFTSRFKQATGLTPTRWRRMAQQRSEAAASSN